MHGRHADSIVHNHIAPRSHMLGMATIVKPLSQREATMNIRHVPFLVILVVILAQHAGMIILVGK
jgi:hypothetical protein